MPFVKALTLCPTTVSGLMDKRVLKTTSCAIVPQTETTFGLIGREIFLYNDV